MQKPTKKATKTFAELLREVLIFGIWEVGPDVVRYAAFSAWFSFLGPAVFFCHKALSLNISACYCHTNVAFKWRLDVL